MFKSYLHVEKFGRTEVCGINDGVVYIFPKLDGSNNCCWFENGSLHCGSRSRELNIGSDNAGFMSYMTGNSSCAKIMQAMCEENPNLIFYGEWLGTKNQIKNYLNTDVFYIFDVFDIEQGIYLDYNTYVAIISQYEYPYVIEPLGIESKPNEDTLKSYMSTNHYNLPSTCLGEGIVIKNYSFVNRYGHYNVAKMVTDEYNAGKRVKTQEPTGDIEDIIAEKYVTDAVLEKNKWKVVHICECDDFDLKSGKMIGMFLNLTWSDFLKEDIADAVIRLKNPTINFNKLKYIISNRCRKFIGLI